MVSAWLKTEKNIPVSKMDMFKNVFALMYVSTGSLSLTYNSRAAYQGYKHLMLYKQSHPHHSDVISYRCTVFISEALSTTAVLSFECYFNTL